MDEALWIFGYGSLVWRPAFPHRARRPGFIVGFARRFWQASTDHRGTPEAPGRVATLIESPGAVCWGMAYQVAAQDRAHVLATLDHREKGGYRRVHTDVCFADDERVRALVYVATPDNPHYLGPCELAEIARVVRVSRGPSGDNPEYVVRLAQALAELGVEDPHVTDLARLVLQDARDQNA